MYQRYSPLKTPVLAFAPPKALTTQPYKWARLVAAGFIACSLQSVYAQTTDSAAPATAAQQSTVKNWGAGAVEVFLKAELLAQDGDYEQAARLLLPMAIYLNQTELFERVARWAGQAKQAGLMVQTARSWELSEPQSEKAKDILLYFLVLDRLEKLGPLRASGKPDQAREVLLLAYGARNRIRNADLAFALAEQLEDDYQSDAAVTVFKQAQTLAKTEAQKQWANAKHLSVLAKQGDANSLTELLSLQKQTLATKNIALIQQTTSLSMAVLRDLKRAEQALALAQHLPADEVVYETALCLEGMGQTDKAENLLRSALKQQPKAAHLLNALGYGLVDRNASAAELAEGAALLKSALAVAPNSAAILDSMGWAYFRQKDYASAQPLLQKAYDLKRDPEVAAHLGELLFATGKVDEARKVWTQGLSLEPKHTVLNSTIKRLGVTGLSAAVGVKP